ncbi:MAG: thioredoxin [Nanoarchaeota archaeon]
MTVKELNDNNFKKEVLQSKKPTIVDFWAAWCGPCRMMAPIFDEISGEYKSKLNFAKINVEENLKYAQQFNVGGIPCLIIFKDGREFDRIVGLQNEDSLKTRINSIIK